MFEAVVVLCLSLAGETCRDQLLPGYEAADVDACRARLESRPPKLPEELFARDGPLCRHAGESLEMVEVSPGVFVHEGRVETPDGSNRGDVANLGFVVGEDSVAAIDTGSARWIGEALWRSVRERTDKPVSHVILTHVHPDHSLGASPLAESGALVVGHASLPRALADRRGNYLDSMSLLIGEAAFLGTEIPQVDVAVESEVEIDIGGRELRLRAWPAAHSNTDLTVLDVESGTLFAGDLVFHRHAPALDGGLAGWRRALDELAGMKLSGLVPGHGDALLDWPEGASDLRRYLHALESDARAAIAEGLRIGDAIGEIAADEAQKWELFREFNPRNATVAYTELEWE